MESAEKIKEIINIVKDLTEQEREQFTSELMMMMVNETSNRQPNTETKNQLYDKAGPDADCRELALLLKRLNHHHDDIVKRIL